MHIILIFLSLIFSLSIYSKPKKKVCNKNKNLFTWNSINTPSRKNWEDNRFNSRINQCCPFCDQLAENNDAKHFIIKRYKYNFLMLNLYPYTSGHMLVVPNQHIANLYDLSEEARNEFFEITSKTTKACKELLNTDGINVGMNLGGPASGASITSHLHMHIVPRYNGDHSFIMVLANTIPLSFNLEENYQLFKKYF